VAVTPRIQALTLRVRLSGCSLGVFIKDLSQTWMSFLLLRTVHPHLVKAAVLYLRAPSYLVAVAPQPQHFLQKIPQNRIRRQQLLSQEHLLVGHRECPVLLAPLVHNHPAQQHLGAFRQMLCRSNSNSSHSRCSSMACLAHKDKGLLLDLALSMASLAW
jgi:hypothetical protein